MGYDFLVQLPFRYEKEVYFYRSVGGLYTKSKAFKLK